MSATVATTDRPELTRRFGAFSGLVGACRNGIARYFVHRAAITSLRKLDDRMLRDIGLDRSQIESAARGLITPSGQRRMR